MAERLGAGYDTYCFNLPQAREKDLSFGPEDLVVLGTPVYAGRVPNLLMPYVRDHIKGNGTLGVPVVLYGNRNYDDGLIELRNLMRDNGFMPVAAGAFVGEHSFSKVLGAGRPDGDDMALVAQLGEKTAGPAGGESGRKGESLDRGSCPGGLRHRLRPHPPLLHPPGPPRGAHQGLFEGQAGHRPGQVREVRAVRPAVPHGLHRPRRRVQRGGQVHQECCACVKKCPTGAKYFDHEGYLYHQHELEDQYAGRRAPSEIFV